MTKRFSTAFVLILVFLMALTMLVSAGNPTTLNQADTASVNDTRAPLIVPQNAEVVPNSYIVVFNKNASEASVKRAIETVKNTNGATVDLTYGTAIKGFAGTLPASTVTTLRRNPNVAYIEANQVVRINETWGTDRVDQRDLPLSNSYNPGTAGAGVHAYVVDTGVRFTHTELGGHTSTQGYDFIDNDANASDCHGHGTHVAGTIAGQTIGIARSATIHGVRVLNCQGSGTSAQVIGGINWVAQNAIHPAVANMSLGGGFSQAENDAVTAAINSGVAFAVAAGNEDSNACNTSPASAPAAITVGASDNQDTMASFSNWGSCVDVFAPGVGITSSTNTSDSSYETWNGTSMATPHVVGVLALHMGQGKSASQAMAAVLADASANRIGTGQQFCANGSVNKLLYFGSASDSAPADPCAGGGGGGGTPGGNVVSGSLTGTGDLDDYTYTANSGTHAFTLVGPGSADFDLYLYKWSKSRYSQKASSLSATSNESISYSGTSGDYKVTVKSYSGSGSYDLYYTLP